jgi:hypothetical protein
MRRGDLATGRCEAVLHRDVSDTIVSKAVYVERIATFASRAVLNVETQTERTGADPTAHMQTSGRINGDTRAGDAGDANDSTTSANRRNLIVDVTAGMLLALTPAGTATRARSNRASHG